ncbi:hypothetical protein [Pseudomonas sp. B10(2017)]|uniref:hypothetical protein n=1 Tax=Pseudomonas sp. B10(2017) TaxID=1981749 RepID=UPI000A1EF92C|nr:hypothetical protein [Pseudomonas sp. B10(2017)]
MASFIDALNQGVNNVTGTPLGQLGLQMLMASGPQQGNPGFGARLGQAFGGMSEMQRVQALQQYRDQMMQVQQQQMQMRQQAAQAETERQRQYQARLQDPNFLKSLSPMARQMAQLGVDPADLIRATNADNLAQHRQATLQQDQAQFAQRHAGAGGGSSGPRTPAPRPYIDQPVGNGLMQRHKFNPQVGDYVPWGEPFSQFAPGRKAATGADAATEAIMGAEAEPVPDTSALPGTGNLQSYAPGQQQAPIGVMPMAAAGGNAQSATQAKPAPKAGMRVPGQAQIARPLTKADYDALPAGAQYIDPVSGKTATKRG